MELKRNKETGIVEVWEDDIKLGEVITMGDKVTSEKVKSKSSDCNMEKKKKSKVFFTVTGMNHYQGQAFLKPGMKIRLEKEPDNKFDKEAIQVSMEGVGVIGYVANSPYTVKGDSISAGRMYDRFKKRAVGKVKYVLDYGAICVLKI